MVFFALLHEVEASALAVSTLVGTPAEDRAGPNARACFEAAQNALMLATADDYAYAGALAYVYFARKDAEFQESAERTYGPLTETERDDWTLDKALREMEETSSAFGPRNTDLIGRARAELESRPRAPDNWAGKSAAAVISSQIKKFGTPLAVARVGDADRWRVSYAHLCRQTHTRLRLKAKTIRGSQDGPVRFEFDSLQPSTTSPLMYLRLR